MTDLDQMSATELLDHFAPSIDHALNTAAEHLGNVIAQIPPDMRPIFRIRVMNRMGQALIQEEIFQEEMEEEL